MNCRSCGAEIADKALVCYRCGTATTEARFKPPAKRSRRSTPSLVASVLALALLLLLALYMAQFATGQAPPYLRWVIVALAAVVVALRLLARRSKRPR